MLYYTTGLAKEGMRIHINREYLINLRFADVVVQLSESKTELQKIIINLEIAGEEPR